MVVNIGNFGDMLLSRPAGKEAFMMAKSYVFKGIVSSDEIILDFNDVKVLTPSWADEFITGFKAEYTNPLQYINTENPSVSASLKTVVRMEPL
jgi:hypothetical protein